jgi:Mrp family chromosome partitioning ATPase
MDEVLAQAKQSYDIVLLDSPPAIVAGDAMVLAAKVDATVLVVRAFQEQRGLVSRLCSQLNDMPSQLVGIVLNRPRNTAGGYFRKNYEVMASYAKSS